ncbi:phosphatase PAP2 family protein [Streptomyces boninensis]|uniref:phosphatase PAP2 family protein n=1 Tax=Streptomyces boninensis TaxID=2039455 RepID=UPI003B21FD94
MRTEDKLAPPLERQTTRRGLKPRMTRTRLWLFGSVAAVYVAIVVGVLINSWLVRLDWQLMLFRPYKQWPEVHAFLDYFVVLGQRGPTALAVLAWLGWCAWRRRTLHPLMVLGVSLLLLNLSVGAAKLGMGRMGPHYATDIGSNEMWLGGDIFPSGHTANAVVTWGILAYLASTPRARRIASVISAIVALGVGLTTVYLGTHWISDVFLGWTAGLLVLLALPWFEPLMARAEGFLMTAWDRLRSRGLEPAPSPLAARVSIIQRPVPSQGSSTQPLPEMASVGARPDGWPHHPARPHTSRHERTPVSPVGPRRPPHTERGSAARTRSAGSSG